MPNPISPAAPTDVLPASFYSALSEELRIEAFANSYPDGSSDRLNLVNYPRCFFKITLRVTGAQYDTLWQFFSSHLLTPFYFYVPRQTIPPFHPDPTGASPDGRYTVVWDGNWSDRFNLGRSEVSLGLREVADPLGAPTSALLTIITSATAEATYLPIINVKAGDHCTGAWYDVFMDHTYGSLIDESMAAPEGWSHRIDTLDVSSLTSAQLSTMEIGASIIGTVFGDGLTTLTINDCYLQLTYAGGDSLQSRYASATSSPGRAGTASGTTITRHHYSGLGDPPLIVLKGFHIPRRKNARGNQRLPERA